MVVARGLGEGPPRVVVESSFPQYAYGLLQAVDLARALGLEAITAIELGVANGNGLLELERLATQIGSDHGVEVHTAGFDSGSGMPPPVDHRDLPYVWREGFYDMDEPRLRSLLRQSALVLGDVTVTGPTYLAEDRPPLGFVAFDLDYYSSTAAALSAFLDGPTTLCLPRTFCYFDDTVGPHEEHHCRFTGELLAIDDFNTTHNHRKLARINGLRYKLLPLEAPWVEATYVFHQFDHPRYSDYVHPATTRQFPLERRYRSME